MYGMGINWQYYYKTNFGSVGSVSRNSVSVPRLSTFNGTVILTRTLVHNLQGETNIGLASPWIIEDNVIDMTAYPPATGITVESVFNDLQLYTIRNNNITGGNRGYVLSQDPFQGNTEGPGLIQGGTITGVTTTGIIATYRAEGNYNASNRWIIDGVTFLNNGVAVNATVPNVPSGYTKTMDIVIRFSTISGGTLGISNSGRSAMTSITFKGSSTELLCSKMLAPCTTSDIVRMWFYLAIVPSPLVIITQDSRQYPSVGILYYTKVGLSI